jgi:hypothetical protein
LQPILTANPLTGNPHYEVRFVLCQIAHRERRCYLIFRTQFNTGTENDTAIFNFYYAAQKCRTWTLFAEVVEKYLTLHFAAITLLARAPWSATENRRLLAFVIAAGWYWIIATGTNPKPWHPVKNSAANFDCKPSYSQPTLRNTFYALPTSAPRTMRLTKILEPN